MRSWVDRHITRDLIIVLFACACILCIVGLGIAKLFDDERPAYVVDGRVFLSHVEGNGKGRDPGRVFVYVQMENGTKYGTSRVYDTGMYADYCRIRPNTPGKVSITVTTNPVLPDSWSGRLLTQPCIR